jgi:CBS domain-containing protein
MVTRDTTSMVVETDEGAPVGFVTDYDFRKRVVGRGEMDLEAPVRTIMSAPLITISEKAMIYEALMRMEEAQVQHLAVIDGQERIGSVVRARELLQFHRYGPVVLLREIERTENAEKVQDACRRLPSLLKALVEAGAKARIVAHMTSEVCDAATSRLIELAIKELGPPPVPFSFIAMGSQGRQEQTLLTDQDNAIIYEHDKAVDSKTTSAYFLSMGKRVCKWLDGAGYSLCDGDVMASNPKWCKSLPEWKADFSDWMMKAEPRELLDFSICLDFRSVLGKAQLAHELRSFIYGILKDRPSFLPHLAQNALLFKPPFRLLGKIIKSGGGPEEAGKLNLKESMMPLVEFGRLYSLHHRMPQTHTMERVEALVWKDALDASTRDNVASTYDFLMRLRFKAQLARMAEGRPLDNRIVLSKMEHLDEVMLKRAFVQIETLQKKIVYDFLGGAEWPGN